MTMCVCGWDESDHTLWMEDGKAAAAVAMQVLEKKGVVCPKCSGMPPPMLQSILDAVEEAGDDADVEEVCVVAAHRFVVKSGKTFSICVAKYDDDDDGFPMFVDLSTAFNLTDCASCDGKTIVKSDAICMGSKSCFAPLCTFCELEGVYVCRKCDPTAPRRDNIEDDAFMLFQMVTEQGWENEDTMHDLANVGSVLNQNRRCFKKDTVVACVMATCDGDIEAWWTKRISDWENKWEFHTPAQPPVKRRRVSSFT